MSSQKSGLSCSRNINWYNHMWQGIIINIVIQLITRLISKYKVQKMDVTQVIGWVKEVAGTDKTGTEKADFVRSKIREELKIVAPYLIDTIMNIVVGRLGLKGVIPLDKLS
jgi:hypothetical protein